MVGFRIAGRVGKAAFKARVGFCVLASTSRGINIRDGYPPWSLSLPSDCGGGVDEVGGCFLAFHQRIFASLLTFSH